MKNQFTFNLKDENDKPEGRGSEGGNQDQDTRNPEIT